MRRWTVAWELSRIAAFAAAILATGVSSAGANDVLYWMVDENATVNEWWSGGAGTQNIKDYFSTYPAESAFAARVRVTGGDIPDGDDVFLDLYLPDGTIDTGNGDLGALFDDGSYSGYWGAGVPTGNQSPSGDYSAGTPEYCFTVELGNIDASDNWTTLATSATATYSSLADYIHQSFDINPGQFAAWTPTQFTAIPEPSSGLLTSLGFAFLALRRKRKGA